MNARPEQQEDPVGERVDTLRAGEEREVTKRATPRAVVVYEVIRTEGEHELARPPAALAWSGLAAGLSMGFSLVAEGLLRAGLPDTSWRPLIAMLGYSVGFLIAILGRQQLFTENTLTPILPLLVRRDLATLSRVLRLWAVVLAANLAGTLAFAWVISHTAVFSPAIQQVFVAIGREAMAGDFGTILIRAVFSGWLIALMVWLLPVAEVGRINVIIILTWLVGVAGLAHIVAGSVEVFFLAWIGAAGWGAVLGGYMLPTLIGNIIGGVALVAILNYAQVVAGSDSQAAQE